MSAHGVRSVLLIGGTSEIGLSIVRRLARDSPVRPYLLGRDAAALDRARAALGGEAAGVDVDLLEARALDTHAETIGRAFERRGGFDVVVLAVGVLGAQRGLDADSGEAIEVMEVNFVACASLLLEAMRRLRADGRPGTMIVLSSVAAERPRAGNAIYGAAKTGLDALAQGLADATAASGPRVLVVRPGFVKTRMTEGLPAAPFATTPEVVAEATVRALGARRETVWVPSGLRVIFALLRHLPRPLYRRLPL